MCERPALGRCRASRAVWARDADLPRRARQDVTQDEHFSSTSTRCPAPTMVRSGAAESPGRRAHVESEQQVETEPLFLADSKSRLQRRPHSAAAAAMSAPPGRIDTKEDWETLWPKLVALGWRVVVKPPGSTGGTGGIGGLGRKMYIQPGTEVSEAAGTGTMQWRSLDSQAAVRRYLMSMRGCKTPPQSRRTLLVGSPGPFLSAASTTTSSCFRSAPKAAAAANNRNHHHTPPGRRASVRPPAMLCARATCHAVRRDAASTPPPHTVLCRRNWPSWQVSQRSGAVQARAVGGGAAPSSNGLPPLLPPRSHHAPID